MYREETLAFSVRGQWLLVAKLLHRQGAVGQLEPSVQQ